MSDVLTVGGHSFGSVWPILVNILEGGTPSWLGKLCREETHALNYVGTREPLETLRQGLLSGELSSIQAVHWVVGRRLLLGVYSPHFAGAHHDEWLLTAAADESMLASYYDLARDTDGVAFLAITADEMLDVDLVDVKGGKFPWSDWRLRRAAVRREDEGWEERLGPGMT